MYGSKLAQMHDPDAVLVVHVVTNTGSSNYS